ncbi:general secretion pathway protein GspB [Acidovorax sp. sic0104]|uniref:general secretion pathway protein GspB n=1 Tax=Acidovorax sp. sic0104 TaxID=2854784 RepID=UPI001C437331|nr:general secretion pathway protein GspB [Acidovorax sp. sic0104]MBV7542391.1 general secretion pathway protein GspB [Acidovorax sp. sic0104]
MSYILDALRRADAERGRGAVPGLHTHATPAAGLSPTAGRTGPSGVLIGVASAAAVAVVAVAGTWWVMQRQAMPAAAPAVALATPPAAAPPAIPAAQPAPVPPPAAAAAQAPVAAAAPTVAPVPAAPAAVAPAPQRPAAVSPPPLDSRVADKRPTTPARERAVAAAPPPQPPATRTLAPLPEPSRSRPESAAAREPLAAQRPQAEPTAAAPSGGPVFAQADLPESVRTQLPTLKVSGATHSNNPAYRMAIVNGQVLHEGDQAAPGLVLERVEPGRTVWTFRGYRYGVASQ